MFNCVICLIILQIYAIEQWARESAESKVVALKKELHALAVECSKAFEVAGLDKNDHPQIAKALELCHTTTNTSQNARSHRGTSSRIADLFSECWKISCTLRMLEIILTSNYYIDYSHAIAN